MRMKFARSLAWIVAMLLMAAMSTVRADETSPVAKGPDRISILGYDTVAYFTDAKAIKGSSSYEYEWNDARWWFTSSAHRDLFISDPDRYAPQFGGFCAGAIGYGVTIPANPQAWTIIGGKLYMVAGSKADMAEWQTHAAENISKGERGWQAAKSRLAAQKQ